MVIALEGPDLNSCLLHKLRLPRSPPSLPAAVWCQASGWARGCCARLWLVSAAGSLCGAWLSMWCATCQVAVLLPWMCSCCAPSSPHLHSHPPHHSRSVKQSQSASRPRSKRPVQPQHWRSQISGLHKMGEEKGRLRRPANCLSTRIQPLSRLPPERRGSEAAVCLA